MKRLITVLALAMLAIAAHAHEGHTSPTHTSLKTLCWHYQGTYHDQWNIDWNAPYHHTGEYSVSTVCSIWKSDPDRRLSGVEYYEGGLTSTPAEILTVDRSGYVLDYCGRQAARTAAIAIAESRCPATTIRKYGHHEYYFTERWTHGCNPHPLDPTGLSGMGLQVTTAWEVYCDYKYYP